MHENKMQRTSGFTLIELLVVVGIMAVLIAIILPTLGSAREKSKKVACLANLHGIGEAMHLYGADNESVLPQPAIYGDPAATKVSLVDAFCANYLKAPKLFFCPSESFNTIPIGIDDVTYNGPNSARISYDFFSIWFQPEWKPRTTKSSDMPLGWDLLGGLGNPTAAEAQWQNHGKTGGHVVLNDASASWQEQKDWDDKNWPHLANVYYGP